MNPLNLPISELKPALAGLARIIGRRTTLPVLSHVRFERTSSGQIQLAATDLDTSAIVTLDVPSEGEPVSVLVPFEELQRIVKPAGLNDTISIVADGSDSVALRFPVGGQTIEKTCDSLPVQEFPPIPAITTEPVLLPETVRQAIHDAQKCASRDETRLILNGAFLDVSRPDAHYVVGTDGRHLFSANSFALGLGSSLLVPSHRFLTWKSFNDDGEWNLKLAAADQDGVSEFELSTTHWRFISKSIAGNYPNWRQVVPNGSSTKTRVSVDEGALAGISETIERLPDPDAVNHSIGLEFSRRTAALLVRAAADAPRTRVPLEGAQVQGSSVTVFVNRTLLTKALRFGLTQIDIIDEVSPLRFWNGGRQMIVMPIRSDAGPAHNQSVRPAGAAAPQADTNSPPATADQRKEESTMSETNGTTTNSRSGAVATGNTEPGATTHIEAALAQIESIKGSYREAIRRLNGLADLLKQASREQKNHEKEISSVRQTLRQIQAVRI
jgi:DNA polymerase III sliding clamp (beta) subunit (PCNA family)